MALNRIANTSFAIPLVLSLVLYFMKADVAGSEPDSNSLPRSGERLDHEQTWPQFRGEKSNSVAESSILPIEFDGQSRHNIAWKVDIPGRSVAGPIVVAGQVIVTASVGLEQRRVRILSYQADSGAPLWEQEFVSRGRPNSHPTSANAAPTPATDGERVYALFSSNDIACVDLKGELVWYRSLTSEFPKASNDAGMGSSPIVIDGVCVVQIECQGESFDLGLNALTGEIIWKLDRPRKGNWSSPIVARSRSGDGLVLMHSSDDAICVNAQDGRVLWSLPIECATIPSSVMSGGYWLVPAGGLTALDVDSVETLPKKLWAANRLNPNACSPIIHNERVYTINRTILACGDLATGKILWQTRAAEGYVWSSPVIVQDNLYLFAQDGTCSVIKLDDKRGRKIATNALGDEVFGSPAVVGNAMYVRSVGALWKIAE